MQEFLFSCPVCRRAVPLGTYQPKRKMCPQCAVLQAQEQIISHNQKHAHAYREYMRDPNHDPLRKPQRPLTAQQLSDALFNVKIKEQLKQCIHCSYSSGKGSSLFCDHIAKANYSREKGSGPGDCRSFVDVSVAPKKPILRTQVLF